MSAYSRSQKMKIARERELERRHQARTNIQYYEKAVEGGGLAAGRRGGPVNELQAEFIRSYEPKDGLQMVEVEKVRALADKIRGLKKAKADKAVFMVAVDDYKAAAAAYLEAFFPYPK